MDVFRLENSSCVCALLCIFASLYSRFGLEGLSKTLVDLIDGISVWVKYRKPRTYGLYNLENSICVCALL